MDIDVDVAIIGGGPAGAATGSLLKKYRPDLSVAIFEREVFPREHVGESLLPSALKVVHEMGCWDDVERADFPIKIGATYRWGSNPALWDFEFIPSVRYQEVPRPARYEGQRAQTAFQVDRARFDQILLENARSRGCSVHEGIGVRSVQSHGDRVEGLTLGDGRSVTASHYVDASGNAAVLRRALGVVVQEPTQLKNVAFWDYWTNTEWAVSIGTEATRILVLSLPWCWIWFIPLGPTLTSIGVVCPANRYKESALSPEEIYERAMKEEPKIVELTAGASREGKVRGTKDWSFLSDRLCGENWYLAGECAGFADPILSAGITLATTGARELAHTIAAIEDGVHDPAWLKSAYEENQRGRISQHIRFADFWYSANGQFTDLKEYTREIARDAGLELNANDAFRWLSTGGFTGDIGQLPAIADISVSGVRLLTQRFTETDSDWALNGASIVKLNLAGASQRLRPTYANGDIKAIRTYERNGKVLPLIGLYGMVFEALQHESVLERVAQSVVKKAQGARDPLPFLFQILETWLADGWIVASSDIRYPAYQRERTQESEVIHDNRDVTMRSVIG